MIPHAFELRPDPVPLPDPRGAYIRGHWQQRVLAMARDRGLRMERPDLRIRSRRALEMAFFARDAGRFQPVHLGLFEAYFGEGRDISSIDVLSEIAERAGLDGRELGVALEAGRYRQEVEDDRMRAASLGIQAVPTILVGHDLTAAAPVVGAVPRDTLDAAIERGLA